MFVFGDSMVDVGNNNFIEKCDVSCKAYYPHYGIDYLDHAPTGRFSNGYNLADHLGILLYSGEETVRCPRKKQELYMSDQFVADQLNSTRAWLCREPAAFPVPVKREPVDEQGHQLRVRRLGAPS
jgi:hypothetical protein